MPNKNETELERRRRQLTVIKRKAQSATDRKDEAALKALTQSYEATEARIRELEGKSEPSHTPTPARRER